MMSKKTGFLVVLSVVILTTVLIVFRLFSYDETAEVSVKSNAADVSAMESIASDVLLVDSVSNDAEIAINNTDKVETVKEGTSANPSVQGEIMDVSEFLALYGPKKEPEKTDMSDEELLDFALSAIDRLNALYGSSLRADRYSIEQLVLIGKFMKGLPLSEDKLADLLPFYLDINLRIHVEDLRIAEQEGGVYVGKEEWIAAHAYQDDIDYWETLVSEGDIYATRLLGNFYNSANYVDKVIQTYEEGLLKSKRGEHDAAIARALADLYKVEDEFTAAVYYLVSKEHMGSNFIFHEMEELVEKFDRNELLKEAREKYEQLEINN
ncbi:hypothetical protein [Planctobacterium marinum]|uniref:Uncharacterized protein n=1 Tax=Planctobacterium marinum TaxID=1631968 RepID=A0AA48KQS0_9ALTE|nr:hypothetical protein MACH26_35920 [Planctobacterium marinum]